MASSTVSSNLALERVFTFSTASVTLRSSSRSNLGQGVAVVLAVLHIFLARDRDAHRTSGASYLELRHFDVIGVEVLQLVFAISSIWSSSRGHDFTAREVRRPCHPGGLAQQHRRRWVFKMNEKDRSS